MKIFAAIFLASIVAITMERYRAEFLLVQVDDNTGRGEKELAEAKFNEKPQDVRGPFPCCGPPPCPVAPPCSGLARSDDDLLNCDGQFNCYNVLGSQCVPLDAVCDGNDNCRNGRDETGCPRIPIKTKCISGDKEFMPGETEISSDGCNTCTCMYGGPWKCTKKACNRLVEVDGMKDKPVKLSAKQCVKGSMLSPSDCNECSCVDDGNCTEVGGCTKIGCPTEQRNAGELCNLKLNNCVDGFKCQKVTDVCDHVNNGRCLKI